MREFDPGSLLMVKLALKIFVGNVTLVSVIPT
jgi:hypothetical protein